MKMPIGAAFAAAAFAVAPMSASAVTLSMNTILPTSSDAIPAPTSISPAGSYFDGLVGNFLPGDGGAIPTSELVPPPNFARSPWDDETGEDTHSYSAVVAGGTATWVLPEASNVFSIMWGSPDTYNDIGFYLGGALLAFDIGSGAGTINGGDLIPPGTPGLGFVNLLLTDFEYDEFRITSDPNDSFEFANVSTIPVPLGVLLIGTAFVAAGAVRRFGRKAA